MLWLGQKKMDTMGNTEKYLKARNLYENKADDGAEIKSARWCKINLQGIPTFK